MNRYIMFFVFLIPLLYLYFLNERSDVVFLSFSMFIVQSCAFLFLTGSSSYSLSKIYYLFIYFFFGIVPIIEYEKEIIYWGGEAFDDSTYIKANIIVFIINIIYFITYNFFRAKIIPKGFVKIERRTKIMPILLSLFCLMICLYVNNFNLLSMIFRGGEFKETVVMKSWLYSIIVTLFRFIPVYIFTYTLITWNNSYIYKCVLFFIAIVCASPFGISRFMAGALYIPIMIVLFKNLLVGSRFSIIFLGFMIFVFPSLDNFRHFDSGKDISFTPNLDSYLSGHFDSYQSFLRVLEMKWISLGDQLLGSIFFFIPRSIWESKPIGTGAEIAEKANYTFSNIAANFFAEGYVNFGLLGILIFVVFFSLVSSYMDSKYWCYIDDDNTQQNEPLYLTTVLFVIILMRGDLNVAINLYVSFVLAMLISKYTVGVKI